MNDSTWHKLWILALLAHGFSTREAHHAFYVLHGNQPIDLKRDPISDALVLLPECSLGLTRHSVVE
ncbi:hypothetical protein [uncultured Oxalicibacterium sp.]|uniref:hypothetical protein n=1 Tax=uncultured Oxalicibacterium sp. TaxID=1168540 RepID=UPI0025E067FB|nr:hypothetical protein [uncultured Oxalicibacterium sp.]